jgi:hypothetical protein
MKRPALILLLLTSILQAGDLKFEKDIYEAHAGFKDIEVTNDFKFTNTGSKPIKIKHVEPGCSCITVEFLYGKATYGTGESGVMRVRFKLDNSQGTIDKPIGIFLATDPDDQPSTQVTFRIHIPIAVSLDKKTLNWDIDSQPETQSIRVNMNYDKPVHVTSVSTTDTNFSTEIVTIEKGKTYDVRVTPKSTSKGGLSAILIQSDIEIDRFRSQQAYARILRPAAEP